MDLEQRGLKNFQLEQAETGFLRAVWKFTDHEFKYPNISIALQIGKDFVLIFKT